MATLLWTGNAAKRANIWHATPASVEIGDTFTLTINGKNITVTATANTVANVVALLVSAIGDYDNDIPEWAEVSASAGSTTTAGVTTANTHVVITGPEDGKPVTITSSTGDANDLDVTVTTLTQGSAGVNEKQLIKFRGTPTGGTFTMTFAGQTTAATAYNASAATVDTNLEALSNIGVGDVTVTGNNTTGWTVEFTGAFAGLDQPLITCNGSSLTGACSISVATTTQGKGATNEIQRITQSTATTNPFRISWARPNGSTLQTDWIAYNASASDVQTALTAVDTQDAGGFLVSKPSGATSTWDIEFQAQYGAQNANTFSLTTLGGGIYYTISTTQEGSSGGVNEVQVVTIIGGPTGGTFTLTFEGQTTAGIAYNAATSAVVSALEALSNIGVGDVAVSGSAGGPYTVTFQAALAASDRQQMTGSGASLTGGAVDVSTTQSASAAVNEQEQVELEGGVTGGTFTLTFNAETTGTIAYNASAATLLAALEALATPVPGDFTVTGSDGGPWIVTFTGAYAATNVTEMTANGAGLTAAGSQSLTITENTTAQGPNWWDLATNWSTGVVPANGDTVIIENSDVDILYGLTGLSAVTATNVHIRASYTGDIGLPKHNGDYYEYRNTAVQMGATNMYVGEGEGQGSSRIRWNFAGVQTAIIVRGTGEPTDDLPAFCWKGTNTSNVLRVFDGSVGVAMETNADAAALATLQVGFETSESSDSDVMLGIGVTQCTTATVLGGLLETYCSMTTLRVDGAQAKATVLGSATVTTLNVQEGECIYDSSGTITTLTVGDGGVIDFRQDMRSRTTTNCTVYSGATIRDDLRTVTWTNPIVLSNCTLDEVDLHLGSHITIAIAAAP